MPDDAPILDPLRATFDYLAGSPNASALRILASALEEPDAAVQEHATTALLRRGHKAGLRALVRAYHTLSTARPLLAERLDDLAPALKDSLKDEWLQARQNAVDLVCEHGAPRVAYLLGQALGDSDAGVRAKAAAGLLEWSRKVGAAWRASRDAPGARAELVGPRNALLSTLWEAFRTFDTHQSREVLAALVHLDPRQLAVTAGNLKDPANPRVDGLLALLKTSDDPPVMAAVYALLEQPFIARPALDIIRERSDLPFIAALLDESRALDREAVRERLRAVKQLPWLTPGREDLVGAVETASIGSAKIGSGPDEKTSQGQAPFSRTPFSMTPQRVTALVRLAALTSTPPESQGAFYGWLARRAAPAARVALVQAVAALPEAAARPAVEAALEDQDQAVETAAVTLLLHAAWPDKSRLLLGRVNSSHEAVRHLVIRELARDSFQRYLESFDRLDPATRELAGKVIQRIDDRFLDQLVDELHALDAKRRFRALVVVQTLHLERELAPHLIERLRDPDRVVRATVVKVLGVVRTLDSIEAIIAALGDADTRVVANTIEVLSDLESERLVGLLTPFLRSPHNRVRANAARALVRLDYGPAIEVLYAMLEDASERMRLSGVWTLSQVAPPGAMARLERLAIEDRSPRIRLRAQEGADRIKRQAVSAAK